MGFLAEPVARRTEPARESARSRARAGDAAATVLALQRSAGNAAVTRALGRAPRESLQRQFAWGAPGGEKSEFIPIDLDADAKDNMKGVPKVRAKGKFTPAFVKWAATQLDADVKAVGKKLDEGAASGTHYLGEPETLAAGLLGWLRTQTFEMPEKAEKVDKESMHYPLRAFTALDLGGRISKIGSMTDLTAYEKAIQVSEKSGKEITLYRYHKFLAQDAAEQRLVLGGGINKAEITAEWADHALSGYLKTRQDLLKQLAVAQGKKRAELMQVFQANALSTPFIATTSDPAYASTLFKDYPPEANQRAVILVIKGPVESAFDFEAEFGALAEQGVGEKQYKGRLEADRAKDAEQKEFGIADPYLVVGGDQSPSGFRVIEVIALITPPVKESVNETLLESVQ